MLAKHPYDQVVYLLQGGGALGAYQVGVCEALLEFGCAPDWVVGTSIGAINAAIIAGNKPEYRVAKLKEFWDIITSKIPIPSIPTDNCLLKEWQNFCSAMGTALLGQPGFFKPRLINPWLTFPNTPDKLSYYDTAELRTTLEKVIDFDLINQKHIRLSLGCVHLKTGTAVYFDNARQTIGPEHVMASSALPPGFPAIKIDDEYYWDAGVLSNTPFCIVFEERTPKKLLCFIINLFSFPEQIPTSMMGVMTSKKKMTYASRHQQILNNFYELHYLQNTMSLLSKTVVNNDVLDLALKKIVCTGHPTSLNVVSFHYKSQPHDLWSNDFDFSPQSLKEHWQEGYSDAQKALNKPTWLDMIDDDSGVVTHNF